MEEDLTNVGNPLNSRHDLEERNKPHVTRMAPEAQADDLFDDSPIDSTLPDAPLEAPQNPQRAPRGIPNTRRDPVR